MTKSMYTIFNPPILPFKNLNKNLNKNNGQNNQFQNLVLDRLFYISHPSISSNLECSINLNVGLDKVFFEKMLISKNLDFEKMVKEMLISKNLDFVSNRLFLEVKEMLISKDLNVGLDKVFLEDRIKEILILVNKVFFEEMVKEISALANFNPKQIEKRDLFFLAFNGVAALKLLNILFKGNEDHALYPIYFKWIEGSEWMTKC